MGLILSIIAAGLLVQPTKGAGPASADVHCGSYCLFVALKTQSLAPARYEDLEQALGPPKATGYSMLELDEYARRRGAKTIAVETTLENLRARTEAFTCLTLIDEGHYVLVYDADDRQVEIVDPPRRYSLPIDTFRSHWSRKALLIGRESFSPEESVRSGAWRSLRSFAGIAIVAALLGLLGIGLRRRRAARPRVTRIGAILIAGAGLSSWPGCGPRGDDPQGAPAQAPSGTLDVTPEVHKLGPIWLDRPDRKIETTTLLKNLGPSPLQILEITKSCDCTSVRIGRRSIPPGESSPLSVQIRPGTTPGERISRIQIQSTDRGRPVREITYEWEVKNPLHAESDSIEIHAVRAGEELGRSVPLHLDGMTRCPRCQLLVTSPASSISCTLREVVASDGAHDGRSPRDSAPIGRLDLKIQPPEDTQLHREVISVVIRCGDELRASLSLPLAWRVAPILQSSPERLSLGISEPGGRHSRKLILRSGEGRSFRLLGVSCPEANTLVAARHPAGSDALHAIELDLKVPGVEGPWRSTLSVETDHPGAERISIPVSALVNPISRPSESTP